MNTTTEMQGEKLTSDLKNVIQDAEELLKMAASDTGAEAVALRERVQARLVRAKDRLQDLQAAAVERAKLAGRRADEHVHEHPWQSVGIAAAIGLLVGVLIGRR